MRRHVAPLMITLLVGCADSIPERTAPDRINQLIGFITPEDEHLVEQLITERIYEATGNSPASLHASMLELGPKDPNDGGAMFSVTSSWFTLERTPGSCSLARVRVETEIVLPNYVGSDQETRSAFDNLYGAIRAHEYRHAQIMKRCGAQIAKEIISMAYALPEDSLEAGNCDAFEDAVRPAVNKLSDDCNQRNVEYDTITQHGFTEGVCWYC